MAKKHQPIEQTSNQELDHERITQDPIEDDDGSLIRSITIDHDEVSDQTADSSVPTSTAPKKSSGFFGRFGYWCKTHKSLSICAATVLVLVLLLAIPISRYALAGTVLKQQFSVEIVDEQTKKPVPAATVVLNGQKATTDGKGKATLRSRVGYGDLEISKKYYQTAKQRITVPILKQKDTPKLRIKATGRQVPIKVTNKITGKPIENAVVSANNSETKTDKDGQGILVVPAHLTKVSATLKSDGYNEKAVDITVSNDGMKNEFALTPSGIVYFLSNQSGTLDIVKSNLDGTNRQMVLKGTGKEEKRATALLASRDWKYLALLSKRDGGEYPKLFLLETGTDKLTVIDEGKATFNLVGWSDDRLIYRVDRVGLKDFDDKRAALKSYHAPTKKITTLDQTFGNNAPSYTTAIYEGFADSIFALPSGEVVFGKNVYTHANESTDKQSALYSIRADGSGRKTLKAFSERNYLEIRPYGPNGVYLSADNKGDKNNYFEYEDGKFEATTEVDGKNFYDAYPTYLWSPSKKQTFWSELRDGKNAMFVGDIHGKNGKQVNASTDYGIFGWFGDDYLLLTKNGSELYILSAEGGTPLKMTDYYKPEINFKGYGGGYGGL
ncbi:MAG TPA: hypothetical protein VF733_05780 [Candidatus Saccharimonadales bacterium]